MTGWNFVFLPWLGWNPDDAPVKDIQMILFEHPYTISYCFKTQNVPFALNFLKMNALLRCRPNVCVLLHIYHI